MSNSYRSRKREAEYYREYAEDLERLVIAMYCAHRYFPHIVPGSKFITPLQTGDLYFRAVASVPGSHGPQ